MDRKPYSKLTEALLEIGVALRAQCPTDGGFGFPFTLPLPENDGPSSIELELPSPAGIDQFDPENFGYVIFDPLGYVRQTWGLARKVPLLEINGNIVGTPIGRLIQTALNEERTSILYGGFRFYNAQPHSSAREIHVIVVNAESERRAILAEEKATRVASAMRRLGTALTMDQTIEPTCISAAHEIASALELAAVFIWVIEPESELLELVTSVGVNRLGVRTLSQLNPKNGELCAAEAVARDRTSFEAINAQDHPRTMNLEAKFCYLKAGGISIHPLISSDKLIGVVEFVGREGDLHFEEDRELFETVAEHLSLALNSAQLFETFERLASRDALTGLNNHRALQEFIHHRMAESKRTTQALGIAMIDVDHFRAFNEEEGHDTGDEVLKLVADALKSCLRPYDLAARYGGEEFTIAMPGANEESILVVAERMRAKVESIPFTNRQGQPRRITVSIGCSCFPETATEPAALLKAADEALYMAKRSGRNCVRWYPGEYGADPVVHRIDFDFRRWLSESEMETSRHRARHILVKYEALFSTLGLSGAQRRLLEGLLQIGPRYEAEQNSVILTAMQNSDELRALMPNLIAVGERYDQLGDRIPLLARIYQVVSALFESCIEDSARFDPKLFALAQSLDQAA